MKKIRTAALPIVLLPLLLFSSLHAQMYKLQTQYTGLESAVYGHGVAVADYNNDGLIDIYFVTHLPSNLSNPQSFNLLLKNNGDGTFTNVALQLGVGGRIDTTKINENKTRVNYGAAWGDFDNDGDVDLYLTNKGADELYENLGNGTFRDITRQAGLAEKIRDSSSAAWFDFDNDGDLDLYVSSYGQYGRDANSDNVLYRNEGNGTFVDVTASAGVGEPGYTYSTMVLDVNLDGWPDLYCVNDFGANHFYLNLGDGTFREATKECGLENAGHGMGVTLGDYDNNGLFDIYLTNIADDPELEWSPLFSQIRTGVFQDVTQQAGTGVTNWAWGCEFLDFDLDGDLDLYVVNGFGGNGYSNRFYRNSGNGSFEDISAQSGADSREDARGLGVADFNNDGYLDLVVANWVAPADLYLNSMTGGNYLKIELVGTTSNRDARGATVIVEADNRSYYRPNDGVEFLGQSKTPLHFGLNHSTMAQRITVNWPSGLQQQFSNIPANRTITITEGSNIVTGVKQKTASQPQQFRLLTNYPNPVREVTQLRFQTPTATDLSIDIYDLLGKKLATPLHGFFPAGVHTFNWQAQNQLGDPLPAGVYVIRMAGKEFVDQRKIVVIR